MGFRLANIGGRAALVEDDRWYDLATVSDGALGPDPMAALAAVDHLHEVAAQLHDHEPGGAVDAVALAAPVPRPTNVFGIGLNYRKHVEESGSEVPAVPVVFTKFPGCIVGPTADVELRGDLVDYEAELVVVIGAGGRDIDVADAWDAIAGLTAGQDISDRALQFAAKPPHFDLGKSRDTYGPIGPVVVSPDLVTDRDAVPIRCEVNGETRQHDDTSQLLFTVPELVAYLSSILTLLPGDLIFTGTPDGVGMVDGRLLSVGDTVTTTLEGIGTLQNRCI